MTSPIASSPTSSVWSAEDGTGPTTLGNIWRVVQTGLNISRDAITRNVSPSEESVLRYRSSRINASILTQFFESMKPKVDSGFEFSAYLCALSIDKLSLSDVTSHLTSLYNLFDPQTAEQMCWGIPLVIESHIMMIVIRGNTLFFFDPKGISAEKQALGQILLLCQEIFRPGKDLNIVENKRVYQWDINNCGVYCALFTYDCLVEKLSLEEFYAKMSALPDIYKEREFIDRCIQELKQETTEEDFSL